VVSDDDDTGTDEFPIGAELAGGRWRVVEVVRGGPDRGQLRANGEGPALVTIAPPQRRDCALVAGSLAWESPHIAPLLWCGGIVGEGVAYDVLIEAEPEGVPLDRWQSESVAVKRTVARELCEAVREAHDRGLVLGAIRPELVYLDGSGLAGITPRAERFFAGATERTYGVPPCFDEVYLAPEQLSLRAPGPPADVFSLGATLTRLLTGRPPFAGASMMERMSAALRGRHIALEAAGPLAAPLAAAMSVEPGTRPSIEELCGAVAAAA
jgi:hypothetical protein